ncbi:MAG TPA: hypothetical protein DEH27_07090 [Deltaproteobacteria bacterium]|nr:hypothetical protein [Deltaproteobacteria bacterium]
MRKYLVALVAVVAVAMVAAPAMADMKASGFYRSKAYLSNYNDQSGSPSLRDSEAEQSNAFVEQRFRVKFDFGSENAKAVWYLESDMIWGDSSGSAPPGAAARNVGGALGGDKVQTETKNIYVWFKIPDTSVETTWGLQAQKDAYKGTFYNADLAGIFVEGKYEPISYLLGWGKLYENAEWKWDDATIYQVEVGWAPSKETKLGFNFYFLQDSTGKPGGIGRLDPLGPSGGPGPADNYDLKLYMPGIDGSMKLGPVKLSGFIFYQTGTFESTIGDPDVDVTAYGMDLRGDLALGPGKVFIEGLYFSGGDNPTDKYKAPITFGDFQTTSLTGPGGYAGWTSHRMIMMLPSWDTINVSQCLVGCSGGEYGDSLGNGGRGIWFIGAGYNQKIGDKMTVEANVGYLSATKLWSTNTAAGLDDSFRDKDMGTEINAGVDYSLSKGLEVGFHAGYLFLGGFVKDPPPANDFEDAYTTIARVNYKF